MEPHRPRTGAGHAGAQPSQGSPGAGRAGTAAGRPCTAPPRWTCGHSISKAGPGHGLPEPRRTPRPPQGLPLSPGSRMPLSHSRTGRDASPWGSGNRDHHIPHGARILPELHQEGGTRVWLRPAPPESGSDLAGVQRGAGDLQGRVRSSGGGFGCRAGFGCCAGCPGGTLLPRSPLTAGTSEYGGRRRPRRSWSRSSRVPRAPRHGGPAANGTKQVLGAWRPAPASPGLGAGGRKVTMSAGAAIERPGGCCRAPLAPHLRGADAAEPGQEQQPPASAGASGRP